MSVSRCFFKLIPEYIDKKAYHNLRTHLAWFSLDALLLLLRLCDEKVDQRWYHSIGVIYFNLGKKQKAMEMWELCYETVGDTYYGLMCRSLLEDVRYGNLNKAIEYAKRGLEIEPQSPHGYIQLMFIYFNDDICYVKSVLSEIKSVLKNCLNYVTSDKQCFTLKFLAWAYTCEKNEEKAMKYINMFIQSESFSYISGFSTIVHCLLTFERTQELKLLNGRLKMLKQKYCSKDPESYSYDYRTKHSYIFFCLGHFYFAVGKHEKSNEYLKLSLSWDYPLTYSVYNIIGLNKQKLGLLPAEYIKDFDKALEINPFFDPARENIFTMSEISQTKAIKHAKVAIEQYPGNNFAQQFLSSLCIALQKTDAGLTVLEKALEYRPEINLGVQLSIISIEYHLDLNIPKKWLGKIMEYNSFSRASLFRSILHLRTCSFQEAIDDLEYYLALKPNDVEALNNLGIAYAALKRFDEATDILMKGHFETKADVLITNVNQIEKHCNNVALLWSSFKWHYPEGILFDMLYSKITDNNQ
eukprot:TRINITY_DN107_c0_g3_i2.p1 TRINITY_DN107_c0_g3~~TRINITY_DN107_c0_g3_i2.p1  ORF type:complete len:526 (-),score=82.76 TRINITY_DN107_c0_g3_i2:22-1599(-)